jgi:hypothetical protein
MARDEEKNDALREIECAETAPNNTPGEDEMIDYRCGKY